MINEYVQCVSGGGVKAECFIALNTQRHGRPRHNQLSPVLATAAHPHDPFPYFVESGSRFDPLALRQLIAGQNSEQKKN